MKLAPSDKKSALILAAAFLIQWALLFAITTPAWDATFYYAYARSIVFDGDLKIANDLQLSYPTTASDFTAKGLDQDLTEMGRVASPFAIGSSIIWLPWLAIIRAAAGVGQILNMASPDLGGYEWFFTGGLAIFSTILGWLAFWISYRISGKETTRFSSLAATLTLLFASPLLYYQYREPLYSHATSAFITALVVFIWWKDYKEPPSHGRAILLGGVIGIAALVRWQHLVYLVLPFIATFWWWWRIPRNQRRQFWRRSLIYLVLVGLSALFVLSFQLVQWRVFYGTWLTVPQGSAYVDWRAPFWKPVLFSTFRGILPWMPFIPLAIAGLILLGRRRARLIIPLLAVLLLETYVNSSTRDWFGGAGYGPRRYTSEITILVLGYAGLIQAIPSKIRKPAAVVAAIILGLHQWLLLRFGLLEKIGGRNLSMYPTYEWVDENYGAFIRDLTGHISDLIRAPLDFFVFPGSPINLIIIGVWPGRHLATLVATAVFVLLILLFISRFKAHLENEAILKTRRGKLAYPILIGLSIFLIIVADIWLLIWG